MPDERLEVYYDGTCELCCAAADAWRREDSGRCLDLQPLQAELPPDAPDRSRLEEAIHVRDSSGWHSGARAVLAIYRRLPGGWLPALLLRAGIALGIADPVYRLIARHRAHLPAFLLRTRERR